MFLRERKLVLKIRQTCDDLNPFKEYKLEKLTICSAAILALYQFHLLDFK